MIADIRSENLNGLQGSSPEGMGASVQGSLLPLDLSSVLSINPYAAENQKRWLPNVQNIAVLRANAIGDFIFSLPALQSLRAAYPTSRITYYGLQWHLDFLQNRPGPIDRVIVIPPMRGLHWDPDVEEDPAFIDAFFQRQQQEHYDLALQMHGGGKQSNPFILRLGAKFTAGLRTPDAEPLDRWAPYVFYQLEYIRWLEMITLVGAQPVALDPHVHVTQYDLDESYKTIPAMDEPLVALHPGAGDPRRRWPVEKFAALGDALSEMGAQVVVTGAYEEASLSQSVVDAMRRPALNAHGLLSLGGLAGLFSRCRVVVSNDSGPLHIARAVGTPTVGIYWVGNMITCGPLSVARHRTAISWRLDCCVCGANTITDPCEHRESFVADIDVDEVRAAVLELWLEPAGAPARWQAFSTEPSSMDLSETALQETLKKGR